MHHPNDRIMRLTADLVALHVSERFLAWTADLRTVGVSASVGAGVGELPPPLHPALSHFALGGGAAFDCSITPLRATPEVMRRSVPVAPAHGVTYNPFNACVVLSKVRPRAHLRDGACCWACDAHLTSQSAGHARCDVSDRTMTSIPSAPQVSTHTMIVHVLDLLNPS